MESFLIILDNPSLMYYSGQLITGRIILKSKEAEKTKGICLKFEGKATVHWTESRSSGRNSHTVSYDSSEIFLHFQLYLVGNGESEIQIPPGENIYPFCVQLPASNIFTSFQGEFGKIEYTLKANVKRSFYKIDYKSKQVIFVSAMVDLNINPMASQRGDWTNSKTFCCFCCSSGLLSIGVKMRKIGYCPGELALIEVDLNNQSDKQVERLSASFIQICTYYAEGRSKEISRSIMCVNRNEGIGRGNSDVWRFELKIPDGPPTNLGGCRIINLDYSIKIEAHVSGLSLNLKQQCPIIIGTIPLLQPEQYNQFAQTPSAPPFYAF